jgi:hypothetical protein
MESSIPPSLPAFSTFLFNLTDIVNSRPAIGQIRRQRGDIDFAGSSVHLQHNQNIANTHMWTRAWPK